MGLNRPHFLFFLIAASLWCNSFAFAQTKGDAKAEVGKQQVILIPQGLIEEEKQNCVNNFNFDKIDLNSPSVTNNLLSLMDYTVCKAVAKDNIDLCNKLKFFPREAESCRDCFITYHGFFGRLLINRRITPEAISACKQELQLSEDACKNFATAILSKNVSVCNEPNAERNGECKAFVTGDSSDCLSDSCKVKGLYINALNKMNIKECDKIDNPDWHTAKAMCYGDIERDEKKCEEVVPGFKKFVNDYCETEASRQAQKKIIEQRRLKNAQEK